MPMVVRVGDANDAGGKVTQGIPEFIVDGRPVAVIGSPVTPHRPRRKRRHRRAKTAEGEITFIIGDKKVSLVGDKDTCGHTRVEGSPNFIIGS